MFRIEATIDKYGIFIMLGLLKFKYFVGSDREK